MARERPFLRSMRLVRRGDFARAFAEGARARGALLLVVAAPNGLGERTRLGLSVGRAIWKSAVRRNRVRRIFREAFRLAYPDLPRGFDLVLIPARPALEPALAETVAELVRLAHLAATRSREPRPERPPKRDPATARRGAGSGGARGGTP
jgi:ribonuclease P protein component